MINTSKYLPQQQGLRSGATFVESGFKLNGHFSILHYCVNFP